MSDRTLVDEQVYKMPSWCLLKQLSFALLIAQKGHFLCWRIFAVSDFQILSDFSHSKSVLGTFLHSWWKSDLKTCITSPKPKIFNLIIFDLMTLDDLDLTQGHKRLRGPWSIPHMIHVVQSAYFNLLRPLCPAKQAMTCSKSWPLAGPVTSSVMFT